MQNKRSTFNPHQKLMWNDSPNNLFESACLTESDLKHFCFGDGGEGDAAVDAASDMEIAAAGTMGVGPAAGSQGGVSEMAGPATPGATTSAEAAESLAAMGFANPESMVNPGIIGKAERDAQALDPIGRGLDPYGRGYKGYEAMGLFYTPHDPAEDLFGGLGSQNMGFGGMPGEALADAFEFGLGLVNAPLGLVGGQLGRSALDAAGIPTAHNAGLGQAVNAAVQGVTDSVTGLGSSAAGLGEDFGAEPGNKHGGMVGKKAGGLTSIKRAQSGGNIGGLSSIGPNLIDVINQGIAMPKNIGTIQRQDKLDINQSNPYGNR